MTKHEIINPASLGAPRGYSNGILAKQGRLLFVAGQIAWDGTQVVSDRLSEQFERAMENVLTVVREAGGEPSDVCRFTIYVTDKLMYLAELKEIGAAYRRQMGRHYPAMALVQVVALVEDRALVEIEATVLRLRSRMGRLRGIARVDGRVVVEGTMTFALGPRTEAGAI